MSFYSEKQSNVPRLSFRPENYRTILYKEALPYMDCWY